MAFLLFCPEPSAESQVKSRDPAFYSRAKVPPQEGERQTRFENSEQRCQMYNGST
jgi:hypothetical protein